VAPDSLNPDPETDTDLAFQMNPVTDPDPAFKVNSDPDPIQIQGFDDQKLKKINTDEIFFIFF
jgi:hypothetical protein